MCLFMCGGGGGGVFTCVFVFTSVQRVDVSKFLSVCVRKRE